MRLLQILLARAGIAAVTLLGVSVLVFFAMRAIPGGFEDMVLGPYATPEARAAVRVRFGLDQPVIVQYWRWLTAALGGDFGLSLVTRRPVMAELLRRAPVTVELALMATGFAVLIGVPLGVRSALPGGRGLWRGTGRLVGAFGTSIPDFVLGAALVYAFSRWQFGLTVGGFVPLAEDPAANLRAMALPALTLGVFGLSLVLRTTRAAVQEVLTQPHIVAAVAAGERPRAIIRHHVLRNAAVPVLTVTLTFLGYLLGGAIIVEQLFSIPGIGHYVLAALGNRDYAAVQAGVLLGAAVFIALNLAADLVYAVIDPRIGQ